jgi:hypothetical protein
MAKKIKGLLKSAKDAIKDKIPASVPMPIPIKQEIPISAVLEVEQPVKSQSPVVNPIVVPVEGDKPGVARFPKPKKVAPAVKHDSVLQKHLYNLLKLLSDQNGGHHTIALDEYLKDLE